MFNHFDGTSIVNQCRPAWALDPMPHFCRDSWPIWQVDADEGDAGIWLRRMELKFHILSAPETESAYRDGRGDGCLLSSCCVQGLTFQIKWVGRRPMGS